MSIADHPENSAAKRSKPPLVTRFLGFLGLTSSSEKTGEDVVVDQNPPSSAILPPRPAAPASAPAFASQAKNGTAHEETLDALVKFVEESPVPSQRSPLVDTRIIALGKQSDELTEALQKKGDTCKRRLTGIRARIEEKIRESEALNDRESD